MLWFHDLTVPDPYFGLPIVCCLVTLALVEYGISMTGEQVRSEGGRGSFWQGTGQNDGG